MGTLLALTMLCHEWAATVENLATYAPEQRLGVQVQMIREHPEYRLDILEAHKFLIDHQVPALLAYTAAYESCSI